MQHFYAYTQKSTGNKSSYKTLFSFFAKLLLVIALAFLAMLINISKSSAQGQLDPSFNPLDHGAAIIEGADKDVRALALQPDGKIIIGGTFSAFNGTTMNRIARINTDGSLDAGFIIGTGVDSTVFKIILQPDGKIILAGAFISYNGISANHLVRLNADGSRDATFNTGTGANSVINTLALQADGKIIAGGSFTSYNGTASNYLVRINADGSRDASFTGSTLNSVNDIAIQADGKVIIGINNDLSGLVTNFLIRLSATGVADATFNTGGTGANSSVKAIKIQTDGKIVFGGDFSLYNTLNTNLTRINTNGTLDPAFDNTSGGLPYGVKVITLQADGKILVGSGEYRDIYGGGDLETGKLVRLNANGTNDVSFQYDFLPELNENVYDILVQADGKLLIAETFISKWSGSVSRYVIHAASLVAPYARDFKINRYNSNGSRDQDFCINPVISGANRVVNAVASQTDNKTLIGGGFFSFNGAAANYFQRLNLDGTKDAGFNAGGIGFNKKVNAIAVQADGKIIVAGVFTSYNGVAVDHITRLNTDGSRDASFTIDPSILSIIQLNSLAIQTDGKILVGGEGRLFRLNTNGSLDNTFNTNVYNMFGIFFPNIYTISIQPDGKVIAGGDFTALGPTGSHLPNIGRLFTDGSADPSFAPNITNDVPWSGTDAPVYASAIQADGNILIGGAFTTYTANLITTTQNHISRLTATGIIDPAFNPGGTGADNNINSIKVQLDGKILIAGNFTSYNGTPVNHIARLNANGTLDASFNSGGTGSDLNINSMAFQSGESKILIGGSFTSYNAITRHCVARLIGGDSGAPPVLVTTIATICTSELPYIWNGNSYNVSGTYTSLVNNSDGSIGVDTLILTIGAGEISGPDRACQYVSSGATANYRISVPAGSTINWSVSKAATMQIISGQGTGSVNIKFLDSFTSGNVYAQVVNTTCGINVKKTYAVSKALPSTPTAIVAGSSSICAAIGTTTTVSYTIHKVKSAVSYNWSAQLGTTTIAHPNGYGVNDTTVNVTFAAGFTTSPITVQAINDCGISNTRSLTINRSNPSTPGAISGLTDVCGFTTAMTYVDYSVPEVAGVTYNWTIPTGATLFAYMTPSHNQIEVHFADTYASGMITVTAVNGCGTSTARSLTVRKFIASTPGAITATNTSACPNRQYTYSIASMPSHALYVQWTVPAGGSIISGQGSTSITVTYTSAAISGYVTAQALNNCSSSSTRKILVSLSTCITNLAKGGNDEQAITKTTIPEISSDMMDVKVFPNPSVSDFKLQVITSGKEEINVSIFEVQGRLLKQIKIAPYQTVNIGAELKAGAYMIEVRQGKNMKTTKVLKF